MFGIVGGAAAAQVSAVRAAVDQVVAGSAENLVLAAAAGQDVVARPAVDLVVRSVAGDHIVIGTAAGVLDRVITVALGIADRSAPGLQVDDDLGGGGDERYRVVAVAAVQGIRATAADQQVVVLARHQRVVAVQPLQNAAVVGIAVEHVVEVRADDMLDIGHAVALRIAALADEDVLIVRARAEDHPDLGILIGHLVEIVAAVDRIGAGPAFQHVVAVAAFQRVGAALPHQPVVVLAAAQRVALGAAGQQVAAVVAPQLHDRLHVRRDGDLVVVIAHMADDQVDGLVVVLRLAAAGMAVDLLQLECLHGDRPARRSAKDKGLGLVLAHLAFDAALVRAIAGVQRQRGDTGRKGGEAVVRIGFRLAPEFEIGQRHLHDVEPLGEAERPDPDAELDEHLDAEFAGDRIEHAPRQVGQPELAVALGGRAFKIGVQPGEHAAAHAHLGDANVDACGGADLRIHRAGRIVIDDRVVAHEARHRQFLGGDEEPLGQVAVLQPGRVVPDLDVDARAELAVQAHADRADDREELAEPGLERQFRHVVADQVDRRAAQPVQKQADDRGRIFQQRDAEPGVLQQVRQRAAAVGQPLAVGGGNVVQHVAQLVQIVAGGKRHRQPGRRIAHQHRVAEIDPPAADRAAVGQRGDALDQVIRLGKGLDHRLALRRPGRRQVEQVDAIVVDDVDPVEYADRLGSAVDQRQRRGDRIEQLVQREGAEDSLSDRRQHLAQPLHQRADIQLHVLKRDRRRRAQPGKPACRIEVVDVVPRDQVGEEPGQRRRIAGIGPVQARRQPEPHDRRSVDLGAQAVGGQVVDQAAGDIHPGVDLDLRRRPLVVDVHVEEAERPAPGHLVQRRIERQGDDVTRRVGHRQAAGVGIEHQLGIDLIAQRARHAALQFEAERVIAHVQVHLPARHGQAVRRDQEDPHLVALHRRAERPADAVHRIRDRLRQCRGGRLQVRQGVVDRALHRIEQRIGQHVLQRVADERQVRIQKRLQRRIGGIVEEIADLATQRGDRFGGGGQCPWTDNRLRLRALQDVLRHSPSPAPGRRCDSGADGRQVVRAGIGWMRHRGAARARVAASKILFFCGSFWRAGAFEREHDGDQRWLTSGKNRSGTAPTGSGRKKASRRAASRNIGHAPNRNRMPVPARH